MCECATLPRPRDPRDPRPRDPRQRLPPQHDPQPPLQQHSAAPQRHQIDTSDLSLMNVEDKILSQGRTGLSAVAVRTSRPGTLRPGVMRGSNASGTGYASAPVSVSPPAQVSYRPAPRTAEMARSRAISSAAQYSRPPAGPTVAEAAAAASNPKQRDPQRILVSLSSSSEDDGSSTDEVDADDNIDGEVNKGEISSEASEASESDDEIQIYSSEEDETLKLIGKRLGNVFTHVLCEPRPVVSANTPAEVQ